MADFLSKLVGLYQGNQNAAPPERQGFAERLISAGQRSSDNVEVRPPDGNTYYDYPADPRTAWTPLGDEMDAVKFENSIGLPTPLPMDHAMNMPPQPDISQGLYHPAGTIDMGPYPPLPSTLSTFAARPPADPRRTNRIPMGGGEFMDVPDDPANPARPRSSWTR